MHFKESFEYLMSLSNRELRKEIENSNWNFILQELRYAGDEIERLNNIINEITNNKHDKTSDEEYLKMSKEALVKIINNKNSVISSLDNENKKLNNIIDALEKWLSKKDLIIETPMVLDKIQELKDGYGEELSDK